MFGRHQTVTQRTDPSHGLGGRGTRSAGEGQPPVDPARLRAALAQAWTIRLRERIAGSSFGSSAA
jgi:hypothetical protein